MKLTYKVVMFLTLLIFCVGNVCAEEPDNNTTVNNVTVVNESSIFNVTVNNVGSDSCVNNLNESSNSPLNLDTVNNDSIGKCVFNMMINPAQKEKINLHYEKKNKSIK